MSIFTYEDPDDGKTYLLNYIVTQHESEGPEYVEWKLADATTDTWHRLPPWAMPPVEAINFWHGEVDHRQGVIVAMKDDSPNVLCFDFAGLYLAELTIFTNVSDPDGDYVAPGMVVEVGTIDTIPIEDPEKLREWLNV